jgi:uncharacterized protein YoxC
MVFSICMVLIALAVWILVCFLIVSTLKLNRLLNQTTLLVGQLNQGLPPILANAQDITANTNTAVGALAGGVQQTASGINYLKSTNITSVAETLIIIRKVFKLTRTLLEKRRKKNDVE